MAVRRAKARDLETAPLGMARGGPAKLRAALIGGPRFKVGDRLVEFRSRKAEALLGYLCLIPEGRLSREMAAGLLWSESSEHHARSSLRQTLLILRRELEKHGFFGLSSDKLTIVLDLSQVETDVAFVLDAGGADGPVNPRLISEKRLTDRLFDTAEGLDEAFTAWLRVWRQKVHDRLRAALEPRLDPRDGSWMDVEAAATALLNLDPTHEPACRAFIRARAVQGDYATALRAYDDLWRVLEDEFDTRPSKDTQALIVDVKLGRFSPDADLALPSVPADVVAAEVRPAASEAPADVRPVFIVDEILPFDETGPEARLVHIFRHDLIARLVRFREWSVVDGDSAELARGAAPIYRVSVSAMSSGQSATFSVTVKNSRTGGYVWGRDFTVGLDQLFACQPQLVAQIAMALNVQISAERLELLVRIPDMPLDCYDRLLRGQQLHFSWRLEASREAESLLTSIIADNPKFSPAYSSLAQILNSRHIMFPGRGRSEKELERTVELGRSAVALDPFDSRAHLCCGWSAALLGHFEEAETRYRQALELNENDPWTSISAAHGLAFCGRFDEAAAIARRERARGTLITRLHWSYFVGIMFLSGDYHAAIEAFPSAEGGYLGVEAWHIAALALTGQPADAERQCKRLEQRVAGKWTLPGRPGREAVSQWLAQCFPIGDRDGMRRLATGLALAELPMPNGAWGEAGTAVAV